jgi:PAS domain S-box-containing protein
MGQTTSPLRVLIVEDSEDDALLVMRELARSGYELTCHRVETPAAMAAALEEREWDVIISDYSMPQFSGPAALALMKEKGVDLPFIIVSRAIGEETAVEVMKAGAHDYVMKRNLTRLGPAVEREVREVRVRRDKKAAAAALVESERRYKELADFLPEAVFEMDKAGRVIFLNKRGRDLFNYTSGDLEAGLNIVEFLDARDRSRAEANAARVMGGEEIGVNPYRAARRDGATFPALVHASRIVREDSTVGLRGVIVDITKLHQAEQERSRLATAVEQAADAVIIADPGGTIRYVNPAFEAVTGYRRGDATGQSLTFLNGEAEEDDALRRLKDALTSGQAWAGHLLGKRKDGSPYEEECTLSPVRDESGELIDYVFVCRDVTEQLRLERQFRHAQKLEALGTLAGGIAHDFNNILMPIIGFAQLLLDGIDGPINGEQQHDLERIVAAGARAQDLIGQILAFSREAEQRRKPVRLGPLIEETLKLMKASLTAAIEVRQRIETEDDTILGDPTRVHQVLINLCTNAGAAMRGRNGILEVSLEDVEADAEFIARNPDLAEGPYVRLTVSDTGCGMTRDVMERIFEPFFTTRSKEGGTGLGLAAVHGIVKSFGGAVRVYSEPGRGTAFHLYLPKSRDTTEGTAEDERPIPTGRERVLVVDDEEAIAELERKTLAGLGYSVHTALSGDQALEIFGTSPQEFDLVVTDQTMPKMTGLSLIRRIRQLRPDIPVILTSGFGRTLSSEGPESLGSVWRLLKPVTIREFGETVRRALDHRAPEGS